MHIFNVWTIIVWSLKLEEWILLELQITQARHPLSTADGKNVSSTPLKNKKKIMKRAQNKRCTFSICEQLLGKVWIKKNENFWSYRLHKLGIPQTLRLEKCLSSTPLKNKNKFMKRAQNKRCTSSIYEQSLGKVWIKKRKLLELQITQNWHPKVFRTDGWMDGQTDGRTYQRPDGRSGPTTRPAFAKATQVKMKALESSHYALIL